MKRRNSVYTKLEKKDWKWIYLFLFPTIMIFVLFYLRPIVTMICTSFTKWDGFNAPRIAGLKNYIKLFTNSAAVISLKNLLWWSLIAMTVHVAFGVVVAFVLYHKPHGWKFTRAVFMIPNVISGAAWALIYRFLFNDQMGVINHAIRKVNPDFHVQWFHKSPYAFWAITLTWLFYGVIFTLLVLNDLYAIPTELEEAARLDGAAGWQITKTIHLPLCRNAIGTSVICGVTSRIAMYEAIALTTNGGPGDDTMSLSVLLVNAITDYNYGFANAIGVIMFVFGVAVLVVVNKAFRMNESYY